MSFGSTLWSRFNFVEIVELIMTKQIPKVVIVTSFAAPGLGWQTILFNCDCHEYEEVIQQIIKATGYEYRKSSQLAYIVHQFGSATIYKGNQEKCEQVGNVLGSIGLLVKVTN